MEWHGEKSGSSSHLPRWGEREVTQPPTRVHTPPPQTALAMEHTHHQGQLCVCVCVCV